MDIFSVITFLGGLAFFLYGMHTLSSGLERMAGGKLESALRKMTSSRFKCLLLGAGITAAIQSSSTVTVMLVGLVNSGVLPFSRSVSVIMGSNIGTTLTAWILTLVRIRSDDAFTRLLKPENFSLIFAFIGIFLFSSKKSTPKKDLGGIFAGFAVLMYGMKLMSEAVSPLSEQPELTTLFTAFQNPLLGVLAGLIITAVIQSSSASVGILQALAVTGAITYGAAIPIIMGQNIGTCVTSLLSVIGVSRNAKKVALTHVSFNLLGTAICLTVYYIGDTIWHFPFTRQPIDAVGIALVHTVFNIATTGILLPFSGQLKTLANRLLPDTPIQTPPSALLDPRLLATPSVAISECRNLAGQMASLASETLMASIDLLGGFDRKSAAAIQENEKMLDRYEDELGTFLVRLSSKRLSEQDSLIVSKILHTIGDFERLGDHAVNLSSAAEELQEKGLAFSKAAVKELETLTEAVREMITVTQQAYLADDLTSAALVEPLEQVTDELGAVIKSRHIARLLSGECSIAQGFILSDILNSLERVSDHCSNIAVAVIALSMGSFDTHRYLQSVRSDSERYQEAFQRFSLKYPL